MHSGSVLQTRSDAKRAKGQLPAALELLREAHALLLPVCHPLNLHLYRVATTLSEVRIVCVCVCVCVRVCVCVCVCV